MASTYTKSGSSKIWMRYKNAQGEWKGKPTEYRTGNLGDERQAELLARKQTEIEASRKPLRGGKLEDWVLGWLIATYGGSDTTTLSVYKRNWRNISKFLNLSAIETAAQIKREHVQEYLLWRTETVGKNQAIMEIKLLSMILKEAMIREQCLSNPFSKTGLRKAKAAEKETWSDKQLGQGYQHFQKHGSLWMRCAFFFGLYQACRLRQCQLPLTSIRLDLDVIQYPDRLVKGREGYTQPIDPRFRPILTDLVKEAEALGTTTLCEVPWDASIRLRRSFDRAGLETVSHHGLRVTWITRAAENGIPESQAMAFCHHESREVHRIYKKLSSISIAHIPALMKLPDFRNASAAAD